MWDLKTEAKVERSTFLSCGPILYKKIRSKVAYSISLSSQVLALLFSSSSYCLAASKKDWLRESSSCPTVASKQASRKQRSHLSWKVWRGNGITQKRIGIARAEQRESFSGLSPDLDLAAVQTNFPSEVENKGFNKGQVDQWMKKAHARPSLAFGVSRGKQKTQRKGWRNLLWYLF